MDSESCPETPPFSTNLAADYAGKDFSQNPVGERRSPRSGSDFTLSRTANTSHKLAIPLQKGTSSCLALFIFIFTIVLLSLTNATLIVAPIAQRGSSQAIVVGVIKRLVLASTICHATQTEPTV